MAPHATSAPLAALLVLQIFAASSGVVGPARRGYYDTLLSRGVGRAQILWRSLAGLDRAWCPVLGRGRAARSVGASRRRDRARARASGSLVALWLASSMPWAATVALPRFAAAIAWLVVLVTTLTTLPSGQSTLVRRSTTGRDRSLVRPRRGP